MTYAIKQQPPEVQVQDDRLSVCFERFDIGAYDLFLKVKKLPEYTIDFDVDRWRYTISAPARFAPMLGSAPPQTNRGWLPLPDFLFDDQQFIIPAALNAKRFACWSDCGLGKTIIGLEFARQVCHCTGGRFLFVTLNEIVPQWIDESRHFYGDALPIIRLNSREEVKQWCAAGTVDASAAGVSDTGPAPAIAITNYEKFNHHTEADQVVNELRHLGGIGLDESQRLKGSGGRQKWALIKSSKGIEYKLSLTATPAPNEIMEFASQAAFLEKMRSDNEIIWTYFTRDPKTHRWSVKEHARAAFFEFMSSWSIYVRDPRRYGWRKNIEPPPEPEQFKYELPITPAQRQMVMDFNADPRYVAEANLGSMFAGQLNAIAANKLSQAAKGFVYAKAKADGSGRGVSRIESAKPKFVADLIAGEAADGTGLGLNVLVWTIFDEETLILRELLEGSPFTVETLTGKTKEKDRPGILERCRCGETRVLISRANMLGYGLNFQHIGSMIFSGWSFSYESFYQAVRRAYRHGQTKKLRVHIPIIPELEGQMWEAIGRKQRQHEASIAEMEHNYIRAMRAVLLPDGRAA